MHYFGSLHQYIKQFFYVQRWIGIDHSYFFLSFFHIVADGKWWQVHICFKAETALQMDKCVEALLNIQPHVSAYCRATGVSLINLVNLIKTEETAGTIKLEIAKCYLSWEATVSYSKQAASFMPWNTFTIMLHTQNDILSWGITEIKVKEWRYPYPGWALWYTHEEACNTWYLSVSVWESVCVRRGKVMSAIAMETEPLCKFCLYRCFISLFHWSLSLSFIQTASHGSTTSNFILCWAGLFLYFHTGSKNQQ